MPSLQSRLENVLPRGLHLRLYHLSTPVTSTSALFAPPTGHTEESTYRESHFLTVSLPQHDAQREVLVYAIEILIFTTDSLTTLFVSKADSSGFLSRSSLLKSSPSIVATITSTFVEYLLEPRLTTSTVVVSLFARSQKQYLFPGSSENAGKHLLDDRQLIKWWCRVLDRFLRRPSDVSTNTAHLVVPGCDKGETRAFFPPSSRADPPAAQKWVNSYPVHLMVTNPSAPPRHLIPRLPDDPKARFMGDLDGDFIDEHGNWRSVRDLAQFWELMSYRQECSAGRLVGFLWLVFQSVQPQRAHPNGYHLPDPRLSQSKVASSGLATPGNSQQVDDSVTGLASSDAPVLELLPELNSPPPSSPVSRDPEHELPQNGQTKPPTATESLAEENAQLPAIIEMQGEIVLGGDHYETLMEFLLETDFAGRDQAATATKSWIDKVMELSGTEQLGQPITGIATSVEVQTTTSTNAASMPVQLLTGIRKKRKAETIENEPVQDDFSQPASIPIVNTLSTSLIRKKPKT